MSVPPDPARQAAIERLDEWAHGVTVSAKSHLPVYPNPAALKADILLVLAALAAAPPSPPKGMCDCGADQVLRGDRVYPALNPDCPVHGTPSPPLIEALEAAKDAINTCDGPCGSAWQVVVAALAAARGETREEPKGRCRLEWCPGNLGASVRCELDAGHEGAHKRGRWTYRLPSERKEPTT